MRLAYHREFGNCLSGKYALVAERLPPQSFVLEIGCHTGYFSRALLERGHRVLGIESDGDAVAVARANGVNVLHEDIEAPSALAQLPGPFDVVLLMDVIEHLRDPGKLLKRLVCLLRPQSRLFVTGPNVAYWSVRKDLLLGRWNYQEAGILDRTHLHFYTADTWKLLLQGAGYKIESLIPAEGMIPLEQWLKRLGATEAAVDHLRALAMRIAPSLFTVVYLLEAKPRGCGNSHFGNYSSL